MRILLLAGFLLSCDVLPGEQRQPGKNAMSVRGLPQDLYFYPAGAAARVPVPKLLFLPGDGGWRGFAVDMAKAAAALGYDTYGWDVKRYLQGFTGGAALKEADVTSDFRRVAAWVLEGQQGTVTLAGWSEGAALGVLAFDAPESKRIFDGLLAIGLPDHGFLGWRLADNLTYITKRDPDEPRFSIYPYLSRIAPRPLVCIYSRSDEYVGPETVRKLLESAQPPKRLFSIDARNHRFDGKQDEFFRAMREALEWIRSNR